MSSYLEEQDFTEQKVDAKLWKRLFAYAMRKKKVVLSTALAMVLVAGVDILYPLLSRYAIDRFVVGQSLKGLGGFVAFYAATVVLQGLCVLGFVCFSGKLEMAVSYDIRQEAFEKLQDLSFSFYDKTAVGYLMARMVSDVSRLSEIIAWSIVDVMWALCYAVGCIITMLTLSWKLGLIVLVVMPPLALISWYLQKKILKYQRRARKLNSRITGSFNEGIMGAKTTKTLVREEANAKEFCDLTEQMKKTSIRSALLNASFFPLVISLGAIGTGLALYFGGVGALNLPGSLIGGISIGTLVAFVSYTTQFFDPIQQLAGILAEFQGAQASAERVITLIDTQPSVTDTQDVMARYGDTFHPKKENWEPIRGDVEFEDVSFSYKAEETILSHFSLSVKAGQTIALVGETGAGKSTIVNLVCRFYEPTEGRILIDGVDYKNRSQLWLQSHLGYVLQQPHLFSGSIRDNIAFGRPEADLEEIKNAARMVHADGFIEQMEQGYDTQVGEGGARLSTGQKQLISFARVILANPRIFVLDEATSSIDTETEQQIQDAITRVLTGRTSFVVAHRLSTIRNADRILVIRGGRVVEDGTHDALMAKKGYYHDLYTHQYREEAIQESLSGGERTKV
ncbi:MAG: ABC transporter ATP-binding protein [Clostridia bacterium]|nr:ABC transporter ATP-binding protein [Clostridia bacterium]